MKTTKKPIKSAIVIVVVFIILVGISAMVFATHQVATGQNGLASIGQIGVPQNLPPPSTIPPQQYVTVPVAYYVGSGTATQTATRPATVRNTVTRTNGTSNTATTNTVTPTSGTGTWVHIVNGAYVPYDPANPN
jgi:hypothetical protein